MSRKLFFFGFGNPKVTVHKAKRSQYINVWKLFKGGNYSRAETIRGNTIFENFENPLVPIDHWVYKKILNAKKCMKYALCVKLCQHDFTTVILKSLQ